MRKIWCIKCDYTPVIINIDIYLWLLTTDYSCIGLSNIATISGVNLIIEHEITVEY